jgi:hypothetical protein
MVIGSLWEPIANRWNCAKILTHAVNSPRKVAFSSVGLVSLLLSVFTEELCFDEHVATKCKVFTIEQRPNSRNLLAVILHLLYLQIAVRVA